MENKTTQELLNLYSQLDELFYLPFASSQEEKDGIYIIKKSILQELTIRLEKSYIE